MGRPPSASKSALKGYPQTLSRTSARAILLPDSATWLRIAPWRIAFMQPADFHAQSSMPVKPLGLRFQVSGSVKTLNPDVQVLSQAKLLATAIFSVVLLGRRLHRVRWHAAQPHPKPQPSYPVRLKKIEEIMHTGEGPHASAAPCVSAALHPAGTRALLVQ